MEGDTIGEALTPTAGRWQGHQQVTVGRMKGGDHSQVYGFSAGLLPRRALRPDTLARNTLDVISFIRFLFLKIRVNIQYIFSFMCIRHNYCRVRYYPQLPEAVCRGKEMYMTAKSRISLLSNSSDRTTHHCHTQTGSQRMLENPREPHTEALPLLLVPPFTLFLF